MLENKKKIILIAVAAVVVIVSVVSAVLLYIGISDLNEADKKLKNAKEELGNLYKTDPYPSRENIEVVS